MQTHIFGRRRHIFPGLAVSQLLLRRDRTVGIDGVAVVNQEIGSVALHHGVGAHPAARFVDAPALAGGIARPYEGNRPPIRRRGAKTPDRRLADDRRRREVLEPDAVKDVLSRRQAFDQRLGREIRLGQSIDEHAVPDVLEAVGGGNLDKHARGTVGPRPHHARIGGNVAGLDAMADQRPLSGEAQIRLGQRSKRGKGAARCRGGEQFAAGDAIADADHVILLMLDHATGQSKMATCGGQSGPGRHVLVPAIERESRRC